MLVLGGGGYNIRSVARCWAYETAVLLDTEINDKIPYNVRVMLILAWIQLGNI